MDLESLRQHYQNLLITQYRIKSKAKDTIGLSVNQMLADGLPLTLARAFDLDTAIGQQLDIIGNIVGVPRKIYGLDLTHTFFSFVRYTDLTERPGFGRYTNNPYPASLFHRYISNSIFSMSDFEMRLCILIKIIQNNKYSSLKDLADALWAVFSNHITISDNKNMTINYHATYQYHNVMLIANYLDILPRPMGVGVNLNLDVNSSSSSCSSSSCRSSSSSSRSSSSSSSSLSSSSCSSSSSSKSSSSCSSSSSCRSSSSSSCRSSSSSSSSCRSSSSSSSCRSSSSSCRSSSSSSISSSSSSSSDAGNDLFTKLLLHMDGALGSITFVDSSQSNYTVAVLGSAQIDTSVKRFGSGSVKLVAAANSYLRITDSDDWNFGSGDFTVDFWFRFNAVTNNAGLWSQHIDNDNRNHFIWDNDARLFQFLSISGGVPQIVLNAPATLIGDNWYHAAIVRFGTNINIDLDGNVLGSLVTSNVYQDLPVAFDIGRGFFNGSYQNFDGWVDEFRISKGIARWTGAFSPPNVSYSP